MLAGCNRAHMQQSNNGSSPARGPLVCESCPISSPSLCHYPCLKVASPVQCWISALIHQTTYFK